MQQAVGLEHRVGVGDEEERIAGHGDRSVDRIRPAPVLFGNHDEVRMLVGLEDSSHHLRLEALGTVSFDTTELEVVDEHVERAVCRAVIDHDDLVGRVVEAEEIFRGVDDDGRFVVRRHDDGDRHGEIRPRDALEFGKGDALVVFTDLHRTHEDKQQVNGVQDDEVDENKPEKEINDGHHDCAPMGRAPCSAST